MHNIDWYSKYKTVFYPYLPYVRDVRIFSLLDYFYQDICP